MKITNLKSALLMLVQRMLTSMLAVWSRRMLYLVEAGRTYENVMLLTGDGTSLFVRVRGAAGTDCT